MADNSQAGAAVGVGDLFATDEIIGGPTGNAKWPFAKLAYGALDSAIIVADSGGSRLPIRLGDSPDGAITTLGTTTDAEATGNGSVVALLKRLRTLLGALGLDATLVAIRDRLPAALVGGRLDVNIGNTPTVDTELPAAAALADATANPSTPSVGSLNLLYNGTTWDRIRGDTTNGVDVDVTRLPALVAGSANIGDVDVASLLGAANFATGQVSIGTTATQIVAARATRRSLLVVNHGTTEVFCGASGVTTSTGLKLEGVDGAALTVDITGAFYGIVGAGTQTISYLEEYN